MPRFRTAQPGGRGTIAVAAAFAITAVSLVATAGSTAASGQATAPPATPVRVVHLPGGTVLRLGPNGLGSLATPGGPQRPVAVPMSRFSSANGTSVQPTDAEIAARLAAQRRGPWAPGAVFVGLTASRSAPAIQSAFRRLGAGAAIPLPAARHGLAPLSNAGEYVVHVDTALPRALAILRRTPGVAWAEPDWTVSTLNTGVTPVTATAPALGNRSSTRLPATSAVQLPTNYGLQSSLESYLNANGLDWTSAYATIESRFGQLPGQGERITNVSLGDLTNTTTLLSNGQRYLNVPSMPLIPTYTAALDGTLDRTGTTSGEDPILGEVLLDFSVMAPLPHDLQRPGEVGSGLTDLLGIAPGASYRLVVAQQPTIANIVSALEAAADQQPHPDVITASLGFGFDTLGFPGRYLEDDPAVQAEVSSIVQRGIVVCISSNDGTRLFTPAPVGPDGGSAATDLAQAPRDATSVFDDELSTIPSRVPDSGAIAVGGTTLDDLIAAPPQDGGSLSQTGTFATTRTDGATNFSSGYGQRVDVSAPSDNIPMLVHDNCYGPTCLPDAVRPATSGGTSASAPMVAAAAAVVLQVARLTGNPLTPEGVRQVLESTGRNVPTPPQIDRALNVGPQVDLGAAVRSLLPPAPVAGPNAGPRIVRFSVAHRETTSGAETGFTEATDPGNIDLAGPSNTGAGVYGPITFGLDLVDVPDGLLTYRLVVGQTQIDSAVPFVRITPSELFADAGQPLASTSPRTFPVTFEVLRGGDVVTSATQQLTFGPTDGTFLEPQAPVVPPVVPEGTDVPVQWDLHGVRNAPSPELVVSSIGHWNPFTAYSFRITYRVPLNGLSGTATIPASVFAAGGGIYGVGIVPNSAFERVLGDFAAFRIAGSDASQRPNAPVLSAGGLSGHWVAVSRQSPTFDLAYDTAGVPGANGAVAEFSAPGPTIYGSYNTFTNANGDTRDANGVDTGSTAWVPLADDHGIAHLNALAIGLPTALFYNVRVLATHDGTVVGQASDSSTLEVDDAVAPGGAAITSFDIGPGGGSLVDTDTFGGPGGIASTAVLPFDPTAESFGPALASDPTGKTEYDVIGDDPSLHRSVVIRDEWNGDPSQSIELYDTQTGMLLADVPVDASTQYRLLAGRVDPLRHRAAILGQSAANGTDTVLPFDLTTGTLGTPIPADVGSSIHRLFNSVAIDESNGKVFLAHALTGDLCIILRTNFLESVDLDTGTASPVAPSSRCLTGLASDQAGGSLYATFGPLSNFSGGRIPLLPQGRWQSYDETTFAATPQVTLGANSSFAPVIDPVNHVALVAFNATRDYLTNNNTMSAIGVVDLSTGALLALHPDFNFIFDAFQNPTYSVLDRNIQIDPATRTAWTYGPGNSQLTEFSY